MPLTKIQSLGITDGTIVNADINASAAIAGTKLTGAGKLLQAITATDSTQRSTTSSSFVTGSNTLSISITPSSASNKIFIICHSAISIAAAGYVWNGTIYRDSTNLGDSTYGLGRFQMGSTGDRGSQMAFHYLDSPSSTSAITYQLYFKADGSTNYVNYGGTKGSITAFEIAG
jgi:hypothetical protein